MSTCSALQEQFKFQRTAVESTEKGLTAGTLQSCASVLDTKKPDESLACPSAQVKFLGVLVTSKGKCIRPKAEGEQKEGQNVFTLTPCSSLRAGSVTVLYLGLISLAASENLFWGRACISRCWLRI